jgi:hypothetical protein
VNAPDTSVSLPALRSLLSSSYFFFERNECKALVP